MDVLQDIMKHADACAGHHADAWCHMMWEADKRV